MCNLLKSLEKVICAFFFDNYNLVFLIPIIWCKVYFADTFEGYFFDIVNICKTELKFFDFRHFLRERERERSQEGLG